MTITISSIYGIEGPSIWSAAPVTLVRLDGEAALPSPNWLRTRSAQLADLLPGLTPPNPSVQPFPLLRCADDGALGAVVGTLALNLQRLVGYPVAFTMTREEGDGTVAVAVGHEDDAVGGSACRVAVWVLNDIGRGLGSDVAEIQRAVARFGTLAATRDLGTAGGAIVAAARARGIPVRRGDPTGRFVELGNGAFRRRISGSVTSLTGAVAESISTDKVLTGHYLREAGLPVPRGGATRTAARSVEVARTIGYPVVVKPVDGAAAVGLSVNVRDDAELRSAVETGLAVSRVGQVLIEEYVVGREYRALVINDQVFAVKEIVSAHVVGDGKRAVRQLIETANADPRRGTSTAAPLPPIVVDEHTHGLLARQELDLDTVPAAGRWVRLEPTAPDPNGGISVDRTGEAHPDNVAILRQAARTVGLDVATMDLVARDIAEPMWATGGAILDINTHSGFRFERTSVEGVAPDPGSAVVEMLYPPGQPARVPIVGVMGDPDISGMTCRLVAGMLGATGVSVGLATARDLRVDGRPLRWPAAAERAAPGDSGADDIARVVLNNPATEVAVVEADARAIVDRGLPFGYCTVAVITGLSGIVTPWGNPVEEVLVGAIEEGGALVLDAGDADIVALTRATSAACVLAGERVERGPVRDHVDRGGAAVVMVPGPGGERVALLADGMTSDVGSVDPHAGASTRRAIRAAVAVGFARGLPLERIRAGMDAWRRDARGGHLSSAQRRSSLVNPSAGGGDTILDLPPGTEFPDDDR